VASPLEGAIAVAGFMGAGKSTIGRELAHRLGRPFADSDAAVERRAGCSVRALWERDGEAAFRALEEVVVRQLLERDDAPVVALGGGALTSEATRRLVRERALCAWLDAPVATCWQRMDGAPGTRPLAGDREAFEQLHDSREPLYNTAADAIVAGDESPEDVAGAIAQQVWTRPGIAEAALGQGRPAASQDRRDGLSCLRRSDMGWRPGPQPTMRDTGCLHQRRDRRRAGRQRLCLSPACWPRT